MKIDEAPVVSHESDVVQNATATITNTVSVMWDDSESDNVNGKNFQRVITQNGSPIIHQDWKHGLNIAVQVIRNFILVSTIYQIVV